MKYLAAGIVSFLVLVGGILFGHSLIPSSSQLSGSTGFTPVSGKTYYLAGAGVTSSANTITLSSFTLPDPNNTPIQSSMFSGTQYGVLEAQTSKTEDITFTGVTQNGNGTATLTGVTRGISFYSPFVASTTLQLAHAGGATFILSNPAAFYAQFLTNTNNNSIYGTFTFSSTSPPVYDADPIWANFSTQALADVSYVNSVVAAGCANGSQTVKGCVQLATQLQSASSTATGSTGAALVGNNLYSTSSPGTAGLWNVWTQNDGKIATTFLNGVEQYIWNGLATFNSGFIDNASSTFTSTVNLNGMTLLNGVSVTPKFGGTGVNGALNISSGTTTISLANAAYFELDYTSVSITGTGALAFSNPNTHGTFIVIKSQGNTTLTCAGECISISGSGSAGGLGGNNGSACSGSSVAGVTGSTPGYYYLFAIGAAQGGQTSSGGTAASLPTAIVPTNWLSSTSTLMKYGGQFWVGSGGGGGECATSGNGSGTAAGSGGSGGGSLLMEIGGSLNLTAMNAIYATGVNGSTPVGNGGSTTCTAGGGGGSGGMVKVFYNSLIANSGTINVSGGNGGNNGTNCGGTAYGGAGGGTPYSQGSSGSGSSSTGANTGGAGASGVSNIEQNTNFY